MPELVDAEDEEVEISDQAVRIKDAQREVG